jgi:hypothetical protein
MDFWLALHSDLQKSITTNKIYYLKSISYYENSKTIVHKSVFYSQAKVNKKIYIPNKNAKKSRITRKKVGLHIVRWCNDNYNCVYKYKKSQF